MRLKHLPPLVCSPARRQGKILSLCLPARVPLQELQLYLARVLEGFAEGEVMLSLSCYLPLLHNELRPVEVMLNEVMEAETDNRLQLPHCFAKLPKSWTNFVKFPCLKFNLEIKNGNIIQKKEVKFNNLNGNGNAGNGNAAIEM